MSNLLFIHRGTACGSPEGHQALGLIMSAKQIRSRLGLTLQCQRAITVPELDQSLALDQTSSVALVMPSWRSSVAELASLLDREKQRRPERTLALMDYYAPTCSPHFGLLPHVDVYIKRQVLRDRDVYQHDLAGGFLFTDYLVKQLGYDLDGWEFGSKPDPAYMDRLVVGWNLGVTPRYRHILAWSRWLPWRWINRPIEVNCRLGIVRRAKTEWYERYREFAGDEVQRLAPSRSKTPVGRVGQKRYLWEMLRSKIVFSPFGWGELCFRDYEAVCCGALLIKPSMEHLTTHPDIFVAGQTYVPVRWDLSDLGEKIEHYLSRPKEAAEIISNAQHVLREYYSKHQVVDGLKEALEAAQQRSTSANPAQLSTE